MTRLPLLALPVLVLSGPVVAADLDAPMYRSREVVVERTIVPRIVERERIIERRYYDEEPAPVYQERVYVEPRRVYDYRVSDETPYAGWRPRYFHPRGDYWHRRHYHHYRW